MDQEPQLLKLHYPASQDFQRPDPLQFISQHPFLKPIHHTITTNTQLLFHIDEQLEKALLESKRFYRKQKWANEIEEDCHDINEASTTIELHYGFYATKINVINFQIYFQLKIDDSYIGQGQFGKICTCSFSDRIHATKMIKICQQNIIQNLKKVYKEYFIALLASQIKAGPKIVDIFGYEIVVLKNYAMFGMELCWKYGSQNQPFQLLEKSLTNLHAFHVMHRDIKPENIMWSCQYQRYVFIDFGLSLIIKQNSSEKTFNSFAGSYSYSSPEMKKLFCLKKPGLVNLYNNDFYAIEKCKKIFTFPLPQNSVFNSLNDIDNDQNSFINSLACVSRIKRFLSQNNYSQAYQLLTNRENLIKTYQYIVEKTIENKLGNHQLISQWKELNKNLRQLLIQKKFKTSEYDDIIVSRIDDYDMRKFWPLLFLSKLNHENFKNWCNNQVWLQRIFFVLNPIIKVGDRKCEYVQQSEEIVCKIYNTLRQPETSLLVKKIRAVYLLFFESLKKFRNKKILQSISDVLALIFDQHNCIKIRSYIIQITEDPLQYCLKCLMYHMLQQNYPLFEKTISTNYLQQIKQKSIKIESDNKNWVQIKLILLVVERIQKLNLRNVQFISDMQAILAYLQQLSNSVPLEKSDIHYMVQRTKIRFIALCESQLLIFLRNKDQNLKISIKNKIQSLTQKHIEQDDYRCVNLTVSNLQFYITALYTPFRTNDTIEYLQFSYEITEGYIYLLPPQFSIQSTNLLTPTLHTLIIQQIKHQVKWFSQRKNDKSLIFHQLHLEMKLSLSNMIRFFRQKDNYVDWSIKNRRVYFQQLEKLQHLIWNGIQVNTTCDEQKNKLIRIYNLFNLMSKFQESAETLNQQNIVEQIQVIFGQIQEKAKNIQRQTQQIIILFLSILTLILKFEVIKASCKKKVQDIFLKVINYLTDKSYLILTPNTLEQLIKIKIRYTSSLAVFNLIKYIILKTVGNRQYMLAYKPKVNVCQAINLFYKLNSGKQKKIIMQTLDSQKQNQGLKELLNNSYGCYLIFLFVYQMNHQKQVMLRYYYKIAEKLDKTQRLVYMIIMSRYFSFFISKNKYRKRKLLICLRSSVRHALESEIRLKSWNKIANIIQTKYMNWTEKAINSLEKVIKKTSIAFY